MPDIVQLAPDGGTVLKILPTSADLADGGQGLQRGDLVLYYLAGTGWRYKQFGKDAADLGGGGAVVAPIHLESAAAGDDCVTVKVTGNVDRKWTVNADGSMEWGDGTAAPDTGLRRISASKLSMSKGATAQTFDIYNTTDSDTAPAVYRRISMNWVSSFVWQIISQSNSTGVDIRLIPATVCYIGPGANHQFRALVYYPTTDNAVALGQATERFTDAHLSGSIILGTTPASAGTVRLPNLGTVQFRNGANDGDITVISVDGSNVVTLGNAGSNLQLTLQANATFGGGITSISFGSNPATSGDIRIKNNSSIQFRNAANSANLNALQMTASDTVVLGETTTGLTVGTAAASFGTSVTSISLGTNPSTSGAIRLPNNTSVAWRNAANSANIAGIAVNASDELVFTEGVGSRILLFAGSLDSFHPNTSGQISLGVDGNRWNSLYLSAGATVGTTLTIGTNPASTGAIRTPNNPTGGIISVRNAANSANITALTVNASDVVILSTSTHAVRIADNASATLGFFGTTPAAKQTSGENLTNNVTSGGTDGTVANYTDLTIYANDAAAIRNDIYQLSRKLKQVNDGLRLYGLLT